MNFLAGLQYKGWTIMAFNTMIAVITDPISLIFMFGRFGNIGEWSVERIILIYAIAVTSFGLAELFNRGFDYFPWRMIQSGDFDRVLLRPQPLFIQIAGSFFHIHRFSRVFGGVCAITWSLFKQGVHMDFGRIMILMFALAGGFLMYSGIFILSSGIAFFTIKALDWIYILTNASYQVTRCPMDYMPKILKYAFTFFMPLLVISYYPAAYICGWQDNVWFAIAALPAGLLFVCFSLIIWRIGVSHYQSTGS